MSDSIKAAALKSIQSEKDYIQARKEKLKVAISQRDNYQSYIDDYEAEIAVAEQTIEYLRERYDVEN